MLLSWVLVIAVSVAVAVAIALAIAVAATVIVAAAVVVAALAFNAENLVAELDTVVLVFGVEIDIGCEKFDSSANSVRKPED